jgi:hypothetical protein
LKQPNFLAPNSRVREKEADALASNSYLKLRSVSKIDYALQARVFSR